MKIFLILFFLLPVSVFAYDFKVLSWNVYMLPKPIKFSLQNTRSEIIPAQIKQTNYDLIFMQEAFMGSFRNKMRTALKATHPNTYYLKNHKFPIPVFGSGLLVLSKFPVKLIDHIYFLHCTTADCLASKGAAMMEIMLPDQQLVQVVNTHLQATKGAGAIRMKQLGQIHQMLIRNRKEGVPQFLIGDLNIDVHEPEFQMGLALLGMNNAVLTGPILNTGGRPNECFKTGHDFEWIDHMWFDNYSITSSEMRVKLFEFERNGKICPSSDHHAIEAAFHFEDV